MLLNLKNLLCIMLCFVIEIKIYKNVIYVVKSFYYYKNELG